MKLLVVYIISFYQKTFGLLFRGACRFRPTCSEYMKQAVLKYGLMRGVTRGIKRISKCHPYSQHFGIDEV